MPDPKIRKRVCPNCRQEREEPFYPKTRSKFFPGGRSIICIACLEKSVDYDDWNTVDKVCQWLDLPFDLNMWVKLYPLHEKKTLSAYLALMIDNVEYENVDWTIMNDKWKIAQQTESMEVEVDFLAKDWLLRMEKKWPGNYEKDDYLYLEQTHSRLCATQNVMPGVTEENARLITLLLLVINQKIQQGLDVSKEIKNYNDLVKASGFEPKNARNMGDFNSIGELIRWLEKNDWQCSYAKEKRDIVDHTIANQQQYLQRLVAGEPNISDQVQTQREALAIRAEQEEEILEGKVSFGEDGEMEYEGQDELEYDLTEYDLDV